MRRMTEQQLDKMLSDYCKAEPDASFVWKAKAAKAPIPLYKRRSFLAAAASIVLVSAVSIGLVLSLPTTKAPVAVYTPPVSSESVTEPTATVEAPTERQTEASQSTEATTATQTPTQAFVISDNGDTVVTEETAGEPETAAPAEEKPTELQPEPDPTAAPDAPAPTAEPTQAPTQEETTPTVVPDISQPITCYGSISNGRLGEDGKVYFKIVATGESIFDDPDVFDDSHLAQVDSTEDGFSIVSFTINRLDVYSPRKKHFYCFYNSNGDILYRDGFDA